MESIKNDSLQKVIFEKVNAGKRRAFSLRMAPMIDVVFLLLLFFLVAVRWRPEENFLPLQLPAAEAAGVNVGAAEPLMIYIFATETGCEIKIGSSKRLVIEDADIDNDLAALTDLMSKSMIEQKRYAADPIEIICDGKVKWEHLTKIYNLFYGAGLTDITFQMTE